MAKGKISASSRKPAVFGRNIRQISQTERLKVMAQKVAVGLTPSDLITDIDCEMFASKTEGSSNSETSQSPEEDLNCLHIQNDATSQTITNSQDYNGSEEIRTSEILQLQSNGFTPLGFYGSRSKNFTPNMKLFGLNSEKNLSKENEDLPMNNLCGLKRKLKRERSSKKVSKKRRTTSGTKQHKNMTNKDKLNSDVNDKDVLVDIDHKDIRSKNQKEPYELVMKTVKEIKDSHEGVVTPPSDYDSEERGIVPICRKPKSNIDVAKSVISEVESTCSETSLCSGPGTVLDGFCLQKNGNEYYFSSSSNVSPVQLTPSSESTGEEEEGIAITHHTINSHQTCTEQNERVEVTLLDYNENVSDSRSSVSLSTSSPDAAESVFTPQLSGKEDESSSSKSSPEHQASIMRYFRSLPGPKCKTKTVANGVPSSSTGHSSAENSLESKNRITLGKKKSRKKQEQMYLDLGQKDFGHVTCPTCGMVYTRAQPDDEAAHIRHHKSFVNGLKFTGWKNECVVKEYHDGRVIMVGPDDPRLHLKKIEEVRKVVDSELGFVADVPYRRSGAKIFLFITRKKVIGCAVAIQIDQGYPVLPSPGESSTPEKQIAAWCCSTTPQSAQCGISRIWVHSQYRRKKVATRLLDCVRTNFIYGCIIPRELVAFSDPTPDGKRLANSYAGTSQFLVFR